MRKFSENEITQIIDNVNATMEMEDLKMTLDTRQLGIKILKDEIKGDKAIEIIRAKYLRL